MQRTALKIFKPQRLGNYDSAGGHRTNNEVESGKLNEVFGAISDVDHARSSLDIVKLYPAVSTTDDSRLQNAHVFIGEQPNDPLVSTLIVESLLLTDQSLLSDMKNIISDSASKFHGTTKSTSESSGNTIELEHIRSSILPIFQQTNPVFSTRAYSLSADDADADLVWKPLVELEYSSGDAHVAFLSMPIPNLLTDQPWWRVGYPALNPLTDSNYYNNNSDMYDLNSGQSRAVYSINNNNLQIELLDPLVPNSTFKLSYRSNIGCRYHSFTQSGSIALNANERVAKRSVKLKQSGSNAVVFDDGSGLFINGDRVVFAQIDYLTGIITPSASVDFNGTVDENLGSVIEKAIPRSVSDPVYQSQISFQLSSVRFVMLSVYIKITLSNDTVFSVNADSQGVISHANCTGSISEFGRVSLNFLNGIEVVTIDYDFQKISTHFITPSWIGLTLDNLGLVDIIHKNNYVCNTLLLC